MGYDGLGDKVFIDGVLLAFSVRTREVSNDRKQLGLRKASHMSWQGMILTSRRSRLCKMGSHTERDQPKALCILGIIKLQCMDGTFFFLALPFLAITKNTGSSVTQYFNFFYGKTSCSNCHLTASFARLFRIVAHTRQLANCFAVRQTFA